MANTASARKRVRQAIHATQRNAAQKSRVRTSVKKVIKLSNEGKQQDATSAYKEAQSLLDRAVLRNLLHKNNVARTKKRLIQKIKAL